MACGAGSAEAGAGCRGLGARRVVLPEDLDALHDEPEVAVAEPEPLEVAHPQVPGEVHGHHLEEAVERRDEVLDVPVAVAPLVGAAEALRRMGAGLGVRVGREGC